MKVTQSCPTLCDPMDYIAHRILQARILKWVAIPFSRGSSQPRHRTQVSHIAGRFFTSWATREVQEYWSGRPIPSPVDLPDPEIEPGSPTLQADSLSSELPGKPTKLLCPWNSPGKHTGVSCLCLLQGTFPIQGLNLALLHCRLILYL